MPSGPGTEHTSRALLKVLHLLTSTLWPPASFCRDREYQGHCCDWCIPVPHSPHQHPTTQTRPTRLTMACSLLSASTTFSVKKK